MNKFLSLLISSALCAAIASSCSGPKKNEDKATPTVETPASSPQASPQAENKPAIDPSKVTTTLEIGSDKENNIYNKTKLSVKAGEFVRLRFKNNSSSSGMEHNWVLVKPGTEDEVANGSIQAGADKGWITPSASIFAHTKMIKPGESDEVIFQAPQQAGNYPYICTFPGHHTTMKGILEVK